MSTQSILKAIKARQGELNVLIERLESSISKREPGTLVRSTINGAVRFYERLDGSSKRIYLNQDKKAILKDLAEKQYEKEILAAAKEESRILHDYAQTLSEFNDLHNNDAIYEKLPHELRKLVNKGLHIEDDYVLRWRKSKFLKARTTEYHIFDTLAKEKSQIKKRGPDC